MGRALAVVLVVCWLISMVLWLLLDTTVTAGAKDIVSTPPAKEQNYKSGEGLEKCEAIHAEQNAILQCKNTELIEKAYITLSPCVTCVKLLLNTSCKEIVYLEDYVNKDAERIWKNANRL